MTLLLCFALFALLAGLWVSAPLFCTSSSIQYGPWCSTLLPLILLTLLLYAVFGHQQAWQEWEKHGRAHYELMNQVQKLGGLQGLIQGVKARLAQNPDDIQGWQLLAKLYAANHEMQEAQTAEWEVKRRETKRL